MRQLYTDCLRAAGPMACLLLTIACTSAAPTTAPAVQQPPASPVANATRELPPRLPPAQPQPTERPAPPARYTVTEFAVPAGSAPHDVAPARDGGVWYAAQRSGMLGWLDSKTGATKSIPLGRGSAPHGVIVGPDGNAWLTDGGLNAIVRVHAASHDVKVYPLPANRPNANLNTAAFDIKGMLWFTGQNGIYGRLDPQSGEMQVWDAPKGRGPYGITATPDGGVYYTSLAGSYVGRIDPATGAVTVLEPPTPGQGARRVWTDSQSNVWVSEWNSGNVSVYRAARGEWQQWKLPGTRPQTYAVYVDDRDLVWLSDWATNTMVRFDPLTEGFLTVPLPSANSNVRQILGRPGEVWLPLSGVDKLAVIRPE